MSTIDTIEDKISLIDDNKTVLELKEIFQVNQSDEDLFKRYMETKGKLFYINLANKLILDHKIVDKRDINFVCLNAIFKYDKKLRKILFQFVAAIEEKIRAFILNNYSAEKWKILENKKLTKKIEYHDGNILIALENSTLNDVFGYVLSLKDNEKELIFNSGVVNQYFELNLRAIRILRNNVFHSHLLFLKPRKDYDDMPLEICYPLQKYGNDDSLSNNIFNLYCFLDSGFQQAFKEKMKTTLEKESEEFQNYIKKYYNLGIENW